MSVIFRQEEITEKYEEYEEEEEEGVSEENNSVVLLVDEGLVVPVKGGGSGSYRPIQEGHQLHFTL